MKLRPAEEIIKENFQFFNTLASSDKRAFIDCVNAGRKEALEVAAEVHEAKTFSIMTIKKKIKQYKG